VRRLDRREIRPDGWGIDLVELEPGQKAILLDAPPPGALGTGLSLAQAAHLARSLEALILTAGTRHRGFTIRHLRRHRPDAEESP
jgi:hypothetical protein